MNLLRHRHPYHPHMKVDSKGVLADESVKLLKDFFTNRRKEKSQDIDDQLVLPSIPMSNISLPIEQSQTRTSFETTRHVQAVTLQSLSSNFHDDRSIQQETNIQKINQSHSLLAHIYSIFTSLFKGSESRGKSPSVPSTSLPGRADIERRRSEPPYKPHKVSGEGRWKYSPDRPSRPTMPWKGRPGGGRRLPIPRVS